VKKVVSRKREATLLNGHAFTLRRLGARASCPPVDEQAMDGRERAARYA